MSSVPSAVPAAAPPLRVLLADDDSVVRELLARLFARRPDVRVVATACNGQEAIDLAAALQTDVIVHARSAPQVSVRLLPDQVHVEVTDQDRSVAHPLPPSEKRSSGRGLAIVESLAMGWGTAVLPQGEVVWFDVARGPA